MQIQMKIQRTAGKIKGQKIHKGIRKTGHKSCISK